MEKSRIDGSTHTMESREVEAIEAVLVSVFGARDMVVRLVNEETGRIFGWRMYGEIRLLRDELSEEVLRALKFAWHAGRDHFDEPTQCTEALAPSHPEHAWRALILAYGGHRPPARLLVLDETVKARAIEGVTIERVLGTKPGWRIGKDFSLPLETALSMSHEELISLTDETVARASENAHIRRISDEVAEIRAEVAKHALRMAHLRGDPTGETAHIPDHWRNPAKLPA